MIQTGGLLPERSGIEIVFYPISTLNKRLNGIGIADYLPAQSDLALMAEFSFLKFFNSQIFFFQVALDQLEALNKKDTENGVFALFEGKLSSYTDVAVRNRFGIYEDKYTGKPNPLKHMIFESKKIDERKRKCILLAVDYGFPLRSIVNFSNDSLLVDKDEIEKEWEGIIRSQRGSIEHDFVRTLKRAISTIKREYFSLFSELAKISDENPFSITRPLFCFLNTVSETGSVMNIPLPRIFFDLAAIGAIFDLKEGSAKDYSILLSKLLKRKNYQVGIKYHIITKSKVKDAYRTRFTANLVFPGNVDLSHIRSELWEIKDITLSTLNEIDPDAHEISQKGRPEIC